MNRTDEAPVMRKRRGIAIGFLFAFVLTTATIIYTGLLVRAPGTRSAATETPDAALEAEASSDGREAHEPGETDPTDLEASAADTNE